MEVSAENVSNWTMFIQWKTLYIPSSLKNFLKHSIHCMYAKWNYKKYEINLLKVSLLVNKYKWNDPCRRHTLNMFLDWQKLNSRKTSSLFEWKLINKSCVSQIQSLITLVYSLMSTLLYSIMNDLLSRLFNGLLVPRLSDNSRLRIFCKISV